MAKWYEVMVKPRQFNIGDLVLKKVSLATKSLAHGKLGPIKGEDPTTWRPWMRENWSIPGMLST